jgi:alkanesulfonate monooxygenase SsuD/methylene tetrahydromethanopterin reductase-like flavin-dependent oxidoreductase (luciferase family)
VKRAVSMPNMADPATIVSLAVLAEEVGYDGVFLWDHVVYGDFSELPMFDPWVLLGAMAGATSRVRLGTLVTPLSRRRPWRVAQEVATLDHLSAGRAVLGVGLGWPPEEEFERFGERSDDALRAEMLDEGLDLVNALWSGEHVQHDGDHFNVDATMRPPPVQQPRVPVWVAGFWPGTRPFERAARWDGVCPLKKVSEMTEVPLLRPDELAACVEYVRDRRDTSAPFDVVVSAHWEHTPDEYADAGATWLVTGTSLEATWPDQLRGVLESQRGAGSGS